MATTTGRTRRLRVGALAGEVVERFERHDLLTSASAISFQVLTAVPPFLLFAFALLGFLHLGDVWRDDVAPHIRPHVSRAAYQVIDDTVERVLSARREFWLTGGLALAVWQMSGAMRAVMGALNRVYAVRRERPWRRRMLVSIGLAFAVGAALLAATAIVTLGPLAYDDVGQPAGALLFLARWGLAGALLLGGVGVLLRWAPAKARPVQWVSVGTLLIVGFWLLASLAFGFYLRVIANYGTVFGNLATVVVAMAYIYLSALALLAGAVLDAILRKHVEGT